MLGSDHHIQMILLLFTKTLSLRFQGEYWGTKFNGVKSAPHHLFHFSLEKDIQLF